MRGLNIESRATNSTLETINAAANAIASAENRVPHARSAQKRGWGNFWNAYWCFGSNKHSKRIGHAPETSAPTATNNTPENPVQEPSRRVQPFIAPPSSPVSFFQSEPPSAIQSPAANSLSLTSVSANMYMYSPGGPRSIFAIGPYAHETQLVSPPVFSTFTTEPSTAPFTPPPESMHHLTTPSSPEVPFARFEPGQRFPQSHYEFQSYQLYPGSPAGQLISPSSCISGSGTSSPFLDPEYFASNGPLKLLNLEKLSNHEWGSRLGSGSLTPDAQIPKSCEVPDTPLNGCKKNDFFSVDHRVSFELTAEDVARCVERKSEKLLSKALLFASLQIREAKECNETLGGEMSFFQEHRVGGETSNNDLTEKSSSERNENQQYERHRSITLESVNEFNFDNTDGGQFDKTNMGASDWPFFPLMQPSVS